MIQRRVTLALWQMSSMVMGTYRTARVELPHEAEKHADASSDSEDDVEEGTGQGGGGDPLSDLPDETEVIITPTCAETPR